MLTIGFQTVDDVFDYIERHAYKRFDFLDGELVEVSPKPYHARLQAKLAMIFGIWLKENPIGYVHTEGFHALGEENFIPDISINAEKADDKSYFDKPPLLALEIRSDTQSRPAQRRKAMRYIAQGTPAVLLIMPGEQVEMFTAESNDSPKIYTIGQTVTNIPHFESLTISVDDLFD